MAQNILQIPSNTLGFDCNTKLSYDNARAFYKHGNKYRYVFRYIARGEDSISQHDLSEDEIEIIHRAGLAIMPVQHVLSDKSWIPSASLGSKYGMYAAQEAHKLNLPHDVNIWLDLEGVDLSVSDTDVIRYCNNWYWMVSDFGFTPGLYVGWNSGLTARQLFVNLAFQHYWGAYNLDSDKAPYRRGLQVKQKAARTIDRPIGITFDFDVDITQQDELGGLPLAFIPDEWSTT